MLKIAVMTRVPRKVPSLTCPYSPNHEVAPLRVAAASSPFAPTAKAGFVVPGRASPYGESDDTPPTTDDTPPTTDGASDDTPPTLMRPVFKRITDADFHKRITRKLIQLAPWRGDDPPQVDPDGKYPFIEYAHVFRHFGRFKVGEEPEILVRLMIRGVSP